ncbi:MAG: response regulator [Methyloceanibacter sp.]|uniref:response regulator n=1 Tax=Methyloceanibacter sp. TaxID=1965321 RepID=UPI003D6CAB4D
MPTAPTPANPRQSPQALAGKSVLIADDDPVLLRALENRFRSLGLRVETTGDGLRTLLAVAKGKPDLLILDLNLPDVDGFRVVERLTDTKFPPLPVIVLTGTEDDAAIQRCEDLGVLYVHKDADVWPALLSAIQQIFDQKKVVDNVPDTIRDELPARTPRILLVDDSRTVLKALTSGLEKYELDIVQASSGMQGYWLTLKERPDLVITDHNMEQGSGHYLLSRIKSTPSTRHIPVIVFTAEALTEGLRHSIQRDLKGRGQAAAFLTKPINVAALADVIGQYVPLRRRPSTTPRSTFG